MIRALRIVVVAGVLGLLLLPAAGATEGGKGGKRQQKTTKKKKPPQKTTTKRILIKRTTTRKIDFTTDVVVCKPNDSALPLTRNPSLHATVPMTSAMNGALMIPTSK